MFGPIRTIGIRKPKRVDAPADRAFSTQSKPPLMYNGGTADVPTARSRSPLKSFERTARVLENRGVFGLLPGAAPSGM